LIIAFPTVRLWIPFHIPDDFGSIGTSQILNQSWLSVCFVRLLSLWGRFIGRRLRGCTNPSGRTSQCSWQVSSARCRLLPVCPHWTTGRFDNRGIGCARYSVTVTFWLYMILDFFIAVSREIRDPVKLCAIAIGSVTFRAAQNFWSGRCYWFNGRRFGQAW
jgi:hypothetical protein